MIWTHSKIAVLDFEGEVSSGVVEFGVVIIKDLNIISTETKLCSPLGKLHPKTSKIHGLKQNDLSKLEPFRKNQNFFTHLFLFITFHLTPPRLSEISEKNLKYFGLSQISKESDHKK